MFYSQLTNINVGESHGQLSSNYNGGDSYSAPPLDSYAPGKYAPSFLKPQQQPQHQPHPQPAPQPQLRPLRPQAPRPQYIPPTPMKLVRPQRPPPSFRPQGNGHAQSGHTQGHAQSIAHGYSSGQSQSHSQSHSQSIHSAGPIRQLSRPVNPLPYRAPVPQGLFQSIGQHVANLDNGQRGQSIGNTYLPPSPAELPLPPMKMLLPSIAPAQPFLTQHHLQQHQHSSGVASSSSSFNFNNQELRNVHVIHDCGKGPQLSQNYGAPVQGGPPALSYGTPLGQPLEHYEAPTQNHYEVPRVNLVVPQHNHIDFSSSSNSYGPPASGPASLDVIGLESQQRTNTVFSAEQQNIVAAGTETHVQHESFPGLTDGLGGSGLNFVSAQKSQSIEIPSHSGQHGNYELQFTTSNSDHNGNRIDDPSHQQILADGLLQSILTAIEKQPAQSVPQVTEDQENDHSEVQVFLKSPEGQEVLADKPADASH